MSAIATYSPIQIVTVNPINNPTIDLQLSNSKRTNIFIYIRAWDPPPNTLFNFYDNSGALISDPLLINHACILIFTNSKISKFSISDNQSYLVTIAYTIIEYYDESIINQIPSDFTMLPLLVSTVATGGSVTAFDVTVGTAYTEISTDPGIRSAVDILADPSNTDVVFVGSSTSQTFPLRAGTNITLYNVRPNVIFAKANSGTQVIHVIYGG